MLYITEPCVGGEYSPNGYPPCTPCPVDTYQPSEAQTVCTPCPEGRRSPSGSVLVNQCIGELKTISILYYKISTSNNDVLLPAIVIFTVSCIHNPFILIQIPAHIQQNTAFLTHAMAMTALTQPTRTTVRVSLATLAAIVNRHLAPVTISPVQTVVVV